MKEPTNDGLAIFISSQSLFDVNPPNMAGFVAIKNREELTIKKKRNYFSFIGKRKLV